MVEVERRLKARVSARHLPGARIEINAEVGPDNDQAKTDRQTDNIYKKITETLSFLAYKENDHREAGLISMRTVEGLTIPDMEKLIACFEWLLRFRKVRIGNWKTYLKRAIPSRFVCTMAMQDVFGYLNDAALQ